MRAQRLIDPGPGFGYPGDVNPLTCAPLHSRSPEQTLAAGKRLGERLAAQFPEGMLVLLIGPLGAGKTVMAKGIARGLGIREPIITPTYTIISEYHSGTTSLHHVDLYRIEGRDQMENLGLQDILAGTGFVVVEWGEKLQAGGAHVRVTLSLAADGGRDILLEEAPA